MKAFIVILTIIVHCSLIIDHCTSQPTTEWVQRFNSTGNYDDYVTDMAIDKSGNVYLTGYITINDTNQDYVTIKYNTQGVQKWVRYFDGTDHREDKAGFIEVDDSGDVVVSGSSYSQNSSYDFLTIKYNSNGDSVWVRRYTNGLVSGDMGLDKNGNVYVTGGTLVGDILTIKYSSQGDLIWERYYNGTANEYDIPLNITVDNNSNIYVTGQSTENRFPITKGIIIKYDENGSQAWVVNPPNAFVLFASRIDDLHQIYSIGHSEPNNNTDISTMKLDSSGSLLWQRKFNRSDSVSHQDDFYRGYTLDNEGNSILTCVNSDNVLRWDIATVKYNSNGDFQWARVFGVSSSNDESRSITNDKYGNSYVCGYKDDGLFPKYLILKYDYFGNFKWSLTYNNNFPFGSHQANKILTDTLENIYVTGVSQGNGTGNDIATIKYSQLTKIENESRDIHNYDLLQNYPNPFNAKTVISYVIPTKSFVTIRIFNDLGQVISVLVNGYQGIAKYKIIFDAVDFTSGIYYYSLSIDGVIIATKKLILIK